MAESVLYKEPLSGGLVTSRHPSMLRPGELTRADQTVYKPNDPAIYRAPGRTVAYTGKTSSTIPGLRVVKFDDTKNASGYDTFALFYRERVGDATKNYFYAPVTTAPPLSSLSGTEMLTSALPIAGDGGTSLEAVHFSNRHYLLNGNTDGVANQVFKTLSGATDGVAWRRHGLIPVAAAPTVTAVAGNWPLDDLYFGEGRFWFFTTEVAYPGTDDELESAYDETVIPDYVDLSKNPSGLIPFGVTVSPPTAVNSAATEFRIYMAKSGVTDEWSAALLANAYQVGKGTLGGTPTVTLATVSTTTAARFPTACVHYEPGGGGAITHIYYNFDGALDTNPATDAMILTALSAPGNKMLLVSAAGEKVFYMKLSDWDFSAGELPDGSTIVGSKVTLRARQPGHGSYDVAIRMSPDVTAGGAGADSQPTTTSQEKNYNWTDGGWRSMDYGSDTDEWGVDLGAGSWTAATLKTANAGLWIRVVCHGWGSPVGSLLLDYITWQLWLGSGITIGKPYPIISFQVGNVVTTMSSHTPPPTASTGDVFDGQFVSNDVKQRRRFVYSLPDQPDYFPVAYSISPPLKDFAPITCIRRVADVLCIGTERQLLRVNSLPRSTDSEFDKGRAWEVLDEYHGITGPMAATSFNPTGTSPLLAYVSDSGLKATDGHQVISLSEDIDWDTLVAPAYLGQAILLNDPKHHQLWFFYTPYGQTTNKEALVIHYHPSHAKEGAKFAITGPLLVKAASATNYYKSGWGILTGHTTDGKAYNEYDGDDDHSDLVTGIVPRIETRDLYAAGMGYEWTLEAFWAFHNATSPAMTWTLTCRKRNTGGDLTDDATTKTFTTAKEGLSRIYPWCEAECVRFKLTSVDEGDGFNKQSGIHFIGYLGASHGASER